MDLTVDELAVRIKAGEREFIPILWGKVRGFIHFCAIKYRGVWRENACFDMDDFIQCGYLALEEAIRIYNPEKQFSFASYLKMVYRRMIYSMFGECRNGKRGFPVAAKSLNNLVDIEGNGLELIDLLVDTGNSHFVEDYEQKEMREVFQKAIDGLGIKERTVIIKRYYEGKGMKQVIDNIHFYTVHNVETAEQRALKALRQDKAIQELHKAYFYTAPRPIDSTNFRPESVVVLNEVNDEWLKKKKDEIDSLEKEQQSRVFADTIWDDWIQELNNELEGIVQ